MYIGNVDVEEVGRRPHGLEEHGRCMDAKAAVVLLWVYDGQWTTDRRTNSRVILAE